MKEYSIGEIFEQDGIKCVCLPVQEVNEDGERCMPCVFTNRPIEWCNKMACLASWRADKKNVFFRPLNDLGQNFHYSKRLGKVLGFKPSDEKPAGVVCRHCALYPFKTSTWAEGCEGALCIGIMRRDRQDGHFVDLNEM